LATVSLYPVAFGGIYSNTNFSYFVLGAVVGVSTFIHYPSKILSLDVANVEGFVADLYTNSSLKVSISELAPATHKPFPYAIEDTISVENLTVAHVTASVEVRICPLLPPATQTPSL
jgi:hypothetical protein